MSLLPFTSTPLPVWKTQEVLEAVDLYSSWEDYAMAGCTCIATGREGPCSSCMETISPEDFDRAKEFIRLGYPQDSLSHPQDAYFTIGDLHRVSVRGTETPALKRVFPCPPNMLAGPEACGLLTGFRS